MYLCYHQHLMYMMELNLHYRPATLSDLPTLLHFEQQLIATERPMDAALKTTDTYYYNLPAQIQLPNVRLLLALHNDQIVGCGYAKILENTAKFAETLYGYIGFMFVLPDYRGQQIGGQIIEQLKDWLRQRGIKEVRLDVYQQNPRAIRSYEKVGFTPHLINMRCVLD